MAGPVLFFLTMEQGTAFAAEAALFMLVALVAIAGSERAASPADRDGPPPGRPRR